MGAWRLCRKIGDARAPRSAGCSKINSAPAVCAARSRAVVHRIAGSPITLSLSRTGGGPPSAASSQWKKRDTEKIEKGGEAMTAA
eukprot:6210834-Pleurochrysis_carterae.AAC.2